MAAHYWKYTITDKTQNKTVEGINLKALFVELGYKSCTPLYQKPEKFEVVKEQLPQPIFQPINPERRRKYNKITKSEKKHSTYNCWTVEQFRQIPNVLVCENKCYKYKRDNLKLPALEQQIRKYLDDSFLKKKYLMEMRYDTTGVLQEVKNHIIGFQLVVRFDENDMKENLKTIIPILDEIDNKIYSLINGCFNDDIDTLDENE